MDLDPYEVPLGDDNQPIEPETNLGLDPPGADAQSATQHVLAAGPSQPELSIWDAVTIPGEIGVASSEAC